MSLFPKKVEYPFKQRHELGMNHLLHPMCCSLGLVFSRFKLKLNPGYEFELFFLCKLF